ncbi:MAG TPA: trypsin-like peptidase domain-containing protein [Gemmatimonadaceae bacterium]
MGRPLDAAEGGLRTTRLLEVVLGHDDRTVVPDPTASPWRHICALRIRTSTGKDFVGTGWFIGPRTVMTAGHCVFMRDEGGWVASIDVIPALDGTEEPYDHAPSTNFKAVREWTEGDGDSNYDFGAILLDKPLGEQTGWFAFASLPDTTLSSTKANISGYPADRDNATRQYYHARKLLLVQPQRLVYDIDTYGGQSGSAIWLNLEGDRIAVGIHTTGASTTNSGTRITDEVFAFMERWRQDAGDTADTHDAAAAVTKGARGRGRTSRQSEPKSTRKTTYRKGARRASPGAESKDE